MWFQSPEVFFVTTIKVYEDPNHFWREVSPHLKLEEAKNSLSLGLSFLFRTDPTDCIYQSALFYKNQFLGALICSRYMTHSNLLPSPISSAEHAHVLYEKFKSKNIKITGLVAEFDLANEYVKLFTDSGLKTKVNMNQGLYRCRKVVIPQISENVIFRKAKPEDIPRIGKWIEDFHLEAVPHDPPVIGIQIAESKIKKNMIYILEKDSTPVSMACWGRDIETSVSINLVYTPKSLRGHGYASFATAKLTELFLNLGKTETNLYTDLCNPTSNKIYQKIGYEFVCNSIHYGVL